jgi:hypothetical protein
MSPTSELSVLSFAEYLVIFNTFVFGYVATQFFTGWSSVISHREKLVISIEHLVWTIFAFVLLTDIWWGSWAKTSLIVQGNYYFYISLLSPIVFYFLTVFLFPDTEHYSQGDLVTYLSHAFKRIAFLFLLLFLSFLAGSLAFGNVLAADLYFNFAGIGVSLLAMFYRPVWLRRTILVAACCALLSHIWLRSDHEMGRQVSGFSFAEYLTVFITFIYGFVASRFLYGWGVILKGFRKISASKEYVAWTILAFCLMMDIWWNSWSRAAFIEQNIVNFMLSLSVPLMFYFFSATLFPIELIQTGYTKLTVYFHRHRSTTFMLFGLIMVFNTSVANISHDGEVLTVENLIRLTAIGMAATGVFYRQAWYHQVVLVFGWCLLILHSVLLTM